MSKHLYDENKRLRAENARLQEAVYARYSRESKADMGDFILEAVHSFLTGKSALVISDGHAEGSKIIHFQMPPRVETGPEESKP